MLLQKSISQNAVQKSLAPRPTLAHSKVNFRPFRQTPVSRSHVALCRAEAATADTPVFKGDLWNKSYYPTGADASAFNKRWYIIDAKGKTLGRLATLAATYVRGKHLPTYTPSMDMGAYVIVINAEQITMTGRKEETKTYFRHVNGRPGSWTLEKFRDLNKRIPERIVEHAVHGMLPKGRLGQRIKLHLKVYKGVAHPHEAQQPIDITSLIDTKPLDSPLA